MRRYTSTGRTGRSSPPTPAPRPAGGCGGNLANLPEHRHVRHRGASVRGRDGRVRRDAVVGLRRDAGRRRARLAGHSRSAGPQRAPDLSPERRARRCASPGPASRSPGLPARRSCTSSRHGRRLRWARSWIANGAAGSYDIPALPATGNYTLFIDPPAGSDAQRDADARRALTAAGTLWKRDAMTTRLRWHCVHVLVAGADCLRRRPAHRRSTLRCVADGGIALCTEPTHVADPPGAPVDADMWTYNVCDIAGAFALARGRVDQGAGREAHLRSRHRSRVDGFRADRQQRLPDRA